MNYCHLPTGQQGEQCPHCGYTLRRSYRKPPVVPCGVIKQTNPTPTKHKLRPLRSKPPCSNLGDPTTKQARYHTAKGKPCDRNILIRIYYCSLHDECTTRRTNTSLRCCADCADYNPGSRT